MKKIIISSFLLALLAFPSLAPAQTFSMEQENQMKVIIQQITDLQIQLLLARIAELQAQIADLIAKQSSVEQKVDKVIQNTTYTSIRTSTSTVISTPIQYSAVKDESWLPTNRCIYRGGIREYSFDPEEHMTNDGVNVGVGGFRLVPRLLSNPQKNIILKAHLDTTSLTYESEGNGEQDAPVVWIHSGLGTKRLSLGRTDIELNLTNSGFEYANFSIDNITGMVKSQLTIDSMSIGGVEVLGLPITYLPVNISLCQ